jgi:hypothetical protein
VTRDVIADLWPLYVAGEASPDTRVLIEAFLRTDREFEQKLTEVARERLPNLLVGPRPLLQLALVFSCLAFGRLVSDTSFDVSPRTFIATAVVAACFWVAFLVRLFKGRREVVVRVRR